MKEPERTPLDPTTPRAKKVTPIPMRSQLYPEAMTDDIYYPDSDSVYTPIKNNLDKINKVLDEISNEDSENSN
jgi:hypothetical protein